MQPHDLCKLGLPKTMNTSRRVYISVTLAAIIAGAACMASNAEPSRLQVVAGAQLSKALTGAKLYNPRPAIRGDGLETFCPANRWMRTGHRAAIHGNYTIMHDRFCIEYVGMKSSCRRLLRDSTGQYFTEYVDVPALSPIPVVITKTPTCGK